MQTAKEHTKEFFQVFPDLKVSGDVKELFRTVCTVSYTHLNAHAVISDSVIYQSRHKDRIREYFAASKALLEGVVYQWIRH